MGYIPDWQRQSAAKNQPQAQTKSPTKFGVVSKPIFHAEKALHSQGTQTPFTRHYADGGDVEYNETDKGLLGGEIKYRTDDQGRKFVQTKDPMSGRAGENRYYSADDVKEGFKSLFSSKSKPTETLSSPTTSGTDAKEKAANMGSPEKTSMQSSSDSASTGPFSNVEAAVKSATTPSVGGGTTSTTDYSTKTRSNSASKSVSKPAGRKDISGSDAMSFPLKSDSSESSSQSFPVDKSVGVANADRPSKPYPSDAKPAAEKSVSRTRAGTVIKDDEPSASVIPKNTFLTRQRMDDADRAMYAARKDTGVSRTRAGTIIK